MTAFHHVVSYRNSTSNHNTLLADNRTAFVVSYRNSTSNHNKHRSTYFILKLYLIEILHQTTTFISTPLGENRLYLIEILHQTTTATTRREIFSVLYLIEILHQTTTPFIFRRSDRKLYLIEILHQTTTSGLILIDKVLLTGCLPL